MNEMVPVRIGKFFDIKTNFRSSCEVQAVLIDDDDDGDDDVDDVVDEVE